MLIELAEQLIALAQRLYHERNARRMQRALDELGRKAAALERKLAELRASGRL